jgi:DNA-directed RNA polymerase specialized sigma24 family protein
MADAPTTDRLEEAFRIARSGDAEAFAEWMGMIEIPLRRSLRRFAREVDVEVVVQETFLRMWIVACDHGRVFEGENASIRFASRVARNAAFEEIRRNRRDIHLDPEDFDRLPEGTIDPEMPDPGLRRAIFECIERLPKQPRKALGARIQDGGRPDRELALTLRMKLNTFLQNIVRARRLMAACLEKRGVRLEEIRS